MRYYQLIPRTWKIIGLETFVFGSFIGICFLINAIITYIPDNPLQPGINFVYAALKVGIGIVLVVIWLLIWYLITKRLMRNDKINEQKIVKSN